MAELQRPGEDLQQIEVGSRDELFAVLISVFERYEALGQIQESLAVLRIIDLFNTYLPSSPQVFFVEFTRAQIDKAGTENDLEKAQFWSEMFLKYHEKFKAYTNKKDRLRGGVRGLFARAGRLNLKEFFSQAKQRVVGVIKNFGSKIADSVDGRRHRARRRQERIARGKVQELLDEINVLTGEEDASGSEDETTTSSVPRSEQDILDQIILEEEGQDEDGLDINILTTEEERQEENGDETRQGDSSGDVRDTNAAERDGREEASPSAEEIAKIEYTRQISEALMSLLENPQIAELMGFTKAFRREQQKPETLDESEKKHLAEIARGLFSQRLVMTTQSKPAAAFIASMDAEDPAVFFNAWFSLSGLKEVGDPITSEVLGIVARRIKADLLLNIERQQNDDLSEDDANYEKFLTW